MLELNMSAQKTYVGRYFPFNATSNLNNGKKGLFAEHYYLIIISFKDTVFPLGFLSGEEVDP